MTLISAPRAKNQHLQIGLLCRFKVKTYAGMPADLWQAPDMWHADDERYS